MNEGAVVLEALILKELFRRLGLLSEESGDIRLVQQVSAARRILGARSVKAHA